MKNKCVVTGGCGFIGSYLVHELVRRNWNVVVVDNGLRGSAGRLHPVMDQIEFVSADIRDEKALLDAFQGSDVVFHLAAVNGTENFYKHPELVLDVGVRGILAVVQACQALGIYDLVVASSAEVYQEPHTVPTDESIPLTLPNSLNPRYSYGGSKIISELIALNYGMSHFQKVQVFRPHNVYGPDMGWKHVIPQMIQRAQHRERETRAKSFDFEIKGNGSETRAFAYVDDVVQGIICMYEHGGHREIYNIGNDHEVSIYQLVQRVGEILGYELNIVPTPVPQGSTPRRCPNIEKIKALGYLPKIDLHEGLTRTCGWYVNNLDQELDNQLL